jgi:LysM domain
MSAIARRFGVSLAALKAANPKIGARPGGFDRIFPGDVINLPAVGGGPQPVPTQPNWRWCNKCQGLFFGGHLAESDCPAGGRHADPAQSRSGNYSLPHNAPTSPDRQEGWRWCNKCQGLYFGPGVAGSSCPAGGTHAPQAQSGSGNYSLFHNAPASPDRQEGWRWCNKCQGLYFGPGVAGSSCPAGGTHAPQAQSGSGNYSLPHQAA